MRSKFHLNASPLLCIWDMKFPFLCSLLSLINDFRVVYIFLSVKVKVGLSVRSFHPCELRVWVLRKFCGLPLFHLALIYCCTFSLRRLSFSFLFCFMLLTSMVYVYTGSLLQSALTCHKMRLMSIPGRMPHLNGAWSQLPHAHEKRPLKKAGNNCAAFSVRSKGTRVSGTFPYHNKSVSHVTLQWLRQQGSLPMIETGDREPKVIVCILYWEEHFISALVFI